MKSKKTMLILPVVAVALCAVALIGAGFATNYTGTTANTGNEVKSYYITVTPEDASDNNETYSGVFNKNICYDTLKTGTDTIKYRLSSGQATIETTIDDTTSKWIALGTVHLIFEQSNDNGLTTLTVEDSEDLEGYLIGYKFEANGNDTTDEYVSGYQNFGDISTKESIYITLYYDVTKYTTNGGDNDSGYDYVTGIPDPNPASDVTFTFKATATIQE